MPRAKNYLILAAVFFLAAATIYFTLLRLTFKEGSVRQQLVPRLESLLAGTFQYQQLRVSSFPLPQVHFENVEFMPASDMEGSLKAAELHLVFNPLMLVFGHPQISRLTLKGADLRITLPESLPIKTLVLEDLELQAAPLRRGVPARAAWSARLPGMDSRIQGKLTVTAPRRTAWTWASSEISGIIDLKQLPAAAAQKSWNFLSPMEIREGALNASVHFSKKQNELELNGKGTAKLQGVVYALRRDTAIASPSIDIELEKADFSWNPESEQLEIKEALWTTPIAKLEAGGRILYGTGELQDMRLLASEIAMENLPQYDLFVKESLPLNLGFSGTSSLDISLTGTMDHLSLHAAWDLTPALLTYGRFFSKPKDLPANFVFDFLLKDNRFLSGDFSFRLKEAAAKGTITDLDFTSGSGEVNVITNKFELAGWQQLLPPFEQLDLSGHLKILANFKGLLQDPAEISAMWNITVENAQFLREGGRGLRNVSLSVDYGPVELRSRDIRLEFGGSEISASVAARQWPADPSWKIKVTSPHVEPERFASALEEAFPEFFVEKHSDAFSQAKKFILDLLPHQEPLETFQFEGEWNREGWALQDLAFDAYGGRFQLKGAGGSEGRWLPLSLQTEIERWSLARYAGQTGEGGGEAAGGNLFLSTQFELGEPSGDLPWQQRVTGAGELSVTNGEFYAVDLIAEIARIDELSALASLSDGRTAFDDLRAPFILENGKAVMEKVMLVSRDVVLQGSGETTLDGILNYRLEAFVGGEAAASLGLPFLDGSLSGGKYFGPVPFLLSGPLAKPEMKPDPARLPDLKDNIARRKSNKVLKNFISEDYFFERRAGT